MKLNAAPTTSAQLFERTQSARQRSSPPTDNPVGLCLTAVRSCSSSRTARRVRPSVVAKLRGSKMAASRVRVGRALPPASPYLPLHCAMTSLRPFQLGSKAAALQTLGLAASVVGLALLISYLLLGGLGLLLSSGVIVVALLLRSRGEQFWRVRGAHEVSSGSWLHGAVQALAKRAELPSPRVYVLPSSLPNAVTTETGDGRGAIALSTGLLSMLSPREVSAVVAHEISHLRHGDLTLKRLTTTASMTAVNLLRASVWLSFVLAILSGAWMQWLGLLLLNATLPLFLLRLEARLSRTREFAADEGAAQLTGDPRALASALVTLERATSSPFSWLKPVRPVMDEFSSHPATRERVARLLTMRSSVTGQPLRGLPLVFPEPFDTRWHRMA